MKTPNRSAGDGIPLHDVVAQWPRKWRVVFGIVVCALAGHYIPLLIVTLKGQWTELVFDPLDITIEGGLLVVISTLGYLSKRIWPVASFFCLLFSAYEIQHYVRAPFMFSIERKWPEVFVALGSILLNGYLFSRYVKWIDLLNKDQ